MNPAGDQLLELEILGQTYHVRIQGSKEWAQKVGKIVDETMQEIQGQTRLQDTTKVAILAALNLADRLLILQERGAPSPPRWNPPRSRSSRCSTKP